MLKDSSHSADPNGTFIKGGEMKKALILSMIFGCSIVLLPPIETRAATAPALNAEPQIIIQTRRERRYHRSHYRRHNRWNDRRNERSYWRSRNRYYNRGRMWNRTRITRYGYPTGYRTRTRVRRNWRNY
jgi:hypothetical protein